MGKSDGRLLLIDDDVSLLGNLKQAVEAVGYEADTARSPDEALALLSRKNYRLVITDLRMPGSEGLSIYEAIRSKAPLAAVIVLTGYGTADEAARAIRMGYTDYLRKPISIGELKFRIEKAIRQRQIETEVASLRAQLVHSCAGRSIVGSSSGIRLVLEKISMVAESPATVLIRGETGTGKELVARAIHASSSRAGSPFVTVACAAIPQPLLEGQLFGHKRGAFTGADRDQKGLMELADEGTLFLDEIGDIDTASQVKLLRVLETGELRALGDKSVRKVDLRLIAATNRDLEHAIRINEFRDDLFYRLNVFPIMLPSLRERKEDIPLLVRHFAELHSPDLCGPVKTFSPEAILKLSAYDWPGNVRELENKVRQAILLAPGDTVGPSAVDLQFLGTAASTFTLSDAKKRATDSIEKRLVRESLAETNGIISKAARLIGVARKNFWLLMKKHEIDAEEFRIQKTGLRCSDEHL